MFFCCECFVLSGRVICDEPITRPVRSTDCGALLWVIFETSRMRRPWPVLGRSTTEKKNVALQGLMNTAVTLVTTAETLARIPAGYFPNCTRPFCYYTDPSRTTPVLCTAASHCASLTGTDKTHKHQNPFSNQNAYLVARICNTSNKNVQLLQPA
jgi:hypothetical protein